MARSKRHGSAKGSHQTTSLSSRKANSVGFAKRQSKKAKTLVGLGDDVYEYQTEKSRHLRTNVDSKLSREEAVEYGAAGDSDDDEQGGLHAGRARLIGEHGEDEKLDSEDDEELDSDGAFDDSDDEKFAGFNFTKKDGLVIKKSSHKYEPRVRFADVDLNEDDDQEDVAGSNVGLEEEEEESGDPDEFIDVLDILDGRGEPYIEEREGADIAGGNGADQGSVELDEDVHMLRQHEENSDNSSEGEDEAEDEEDQAQSGDIAVSADEDEDGDSPAALEDLQTFISRLDATADSGSGRKRKAEAEVGQDAPPRKRKAITERTEAGKESEAGVYFASVGKLKLDDLLAPLAPSTSLAALKKSTKPLVSTSGPQTLAAPLATRTQERVDREAAYEQTKQEVDKWSDTMKRIREAEHLSFPLQVQKETKESNLSLAAKFKPTTALESSIDTLLRSAQLRSEREVLDTEALKMQNLTPEEVAARRTELRAMRELAYRAEVKAKRVKKIKSKAYRRIRKRQRAKLDAAEDDEEEDVMDDEKVMKREVERARERATLKHKMGGKWAQSMRGRGEMDGDQRREMEEMLERGEKLRRKIRGEKDGSDSESDDFDGDGDDFDEEGFKQEVVAEARQAAIDEGDSPGVATVLSKKSVFGMKFMQNAMTREQRRAEALADDFASEMGVRTRGDGEGEYDNPDSQDLTVQRTGGRMTFRPGPLTDDTPSTLAPAASDTSSVTLKSSDLPRIQSQASVQTHAHTPTAQPLSSLGKPHQVLNDAAPESNPWLIDTSSSNKIARKKNDILVGKSSSTSTKSADKLRKAKQGHAEEKGREEDDAAVLISVDDVMQLSAPAVGEEPESSDQDNSEIEEQEEASKSSRKSRKGKNRVSAFQQRELVARAFAGDNVVKAFEEAKKREIAADAPKQVDTTLAGWGSWGGPDTRKMPTSRNARFVKTIPGVDPSTRADAGKAHVIISAKRDKKATKYLVKDLPYPYTSKAQYERGMETPMGAEWNTRIGFQRGTLPKVVVKPGTVVEPLRKL